MGGGGGGGKGPWPHLKFEGRATYTLAPLEFWPNFD